jgi:hypothetical protein
MGCITPSHPWEEVHVDLTGPLTKTCRGHSHIIALKCALTGAIEIAPMITKDAEETARKIVELVYNRHGWPRVLYSYQGKEFHNAVVQHTNALFQVKHIRTTAANPRSNGLVERHNLILKDQLAVFTNARQDDWDEFLSVVQFAYMTTVNSRTGYTLFYMLYGREARQPSDTWINAFENIPRLQDYIKRLVDSLQFTWRTVFDEGPTRLRRMNRFRAKNEPAKPKVFMEDEVGDRFYLKRHPDVRFVHYADKSRTKSKINPKMQRRFTGPYTITRRFSPVLYEANIDGQLKRIHILKIQKDPINEHFRQHIQGNCVTQPLPPSPHVQFQPHLNPNGTPFVPTPTNSRPKHVVNQDIAEDAMALEEAVQEDNDDDIIEQDQAEDYEDDINYFFSCIFLYISSFS